MGKAPCGRCGGGSFCDPVNIFIRLGSPGLLFEDIIPGVFPVSLSSNSGELGRGEPEGHQGATEGLGTPAACPGGSKGPERCGHN